MNTDTDPITSSPNQSLIEQSSGLENNHMKNTPSQGQITKQIEKFSNQSDQEEGYIENQEEKTIENALGLQNPRIISQTRNFGFENSSKLESLPKIQESQDIDSQEEMSPGRTTELIIPENSNDFEGERSNTLLSFADEFDHNEEQTQKTQKSMGNYKLPRFFHLSQERSVISNSQTSCLRFISQNDKDDASSFFDDNAFDSRQSSQAFERSQTFRGQNRPPPELLRSDSNFMFGPRYRTKAHDPAGSPMKKTERKRPEYGKGRMATYDDQNPDYEREEKDRRKSLSRLSLSTKKPNFQNQNSIASPNHLKFQNDTSFNNMFFDSQRSNLNDENSNSLMQSETFPRNLGMMFEGNLSQKENQEVDANISPTDEENETKAEANNSRAADLNNWSVLTEPAGEESLMITENMMLKSQNTQNKSTLDGKCSKSKEFGSLLQSSTSNELNTKQLPQKSLVLSPKDEPNKENIQMNNDYQMQTEIKRCSDKTDFGFSSPVQQKMLKSGIMEEEHPRNSSGRMSEEHVEERFPEQIEENLDFSRKSAMEENSTGLIMNTQSTENNYSFNEVDSKADTTKKLTYMERKLKMIQDENRKIMGEFEFKKSYSKLEKEKLERNNQKNVFLFTSVQKQRTKEPEFNSLFMSDTKKHYTKIQLEKMKLEKNENSDNKLLNSKNQTPRQPLQMIQSEAERDNMIMQENSLSISANKSMLFTPQQGDKKRKYGALNSGEEFMSSVDRTNSFKRMKRSDENQTESFEEMLAKSKKKIPRIQIEKQLSKEREKIEKEQELKTLHASLKDVVFKVDNPLVFAKEINLSQSTQSSGRRKNEDNSNRRFSSITKHR